MCYEQLAINEFSDLFLKIEVFLASDTSFSFASIITNYELRITNYELRITNYELRITNYELKTIAHCTLLIANLNVIHQQLQILP